MSGEATATSFDPAEWSKKDFTERVRIGTNLYVLQGIGYPLAAYLFHAVKLALFVAGWMFFCSFTPGLGTFVELHRRGSSRRSRFRRRSCGRASSR